jgi:hypothetical protein
MRKFVFMTFVAGSMFSCLSISSAFAEQRRVAPQDTPLALFKAIYGQYPDNEPLDSWHKADKAWLGAGDVGKLPTWETLPLSHDAAALNARVEKKIAKSRDVCIDFDQVSDSQDPNIARYKIVAPSAQSTGPAAYQIYIQGTWRKDISKITYALVQEEGKWRVDDIVTYSKDNKGRAIESRAKKMLKACL